MYMHFVYLCMIYILHIQFWPFFTNFFQCLVMMLYMHFVYHDFFMVKDMANHGLFCICILYIMLWYAFCISLFCICILYIIISWIWDANYCLFSIAMPIVLFDSMMHYLAWCWWSCFYFPCSWPYFAWCIMPCFL